MEPAVGRRYHVQLSDGVVAMLGKREGGRRTTVILDSILSDYLALHLRVPVGSREAHDSIRKWLEFELLDLEPKFIAHPGTIPNNLSRWLARRVLDEIVRPELRSLRQAAN